MAVNRSTTAPEGMRDPAYQWGALLMLAASAVIVTALGFEYLGGHVPCPLCLQQRWAYYAGIPAAFLALVLVAVDRPRLAALLFLAIAMGFLANAGLGLYQAGAEWKWWPGPTSCAGAATELGGSGAGVLGTLQSTQVTRCDEAQWRLAGLSFAGWNAVLSLALCTVGLQAAFAASARHNPDLSFNAMN